MDEFEKKDETIDFAPDRGKKKLQWILAGVLGVLIVVNIVLVILYFTIGDSEDGSGDPSQTTPAVSTESESTDEETEPEESSSAPESSETAQSSSSEPSQPSSQVSSGQSGSGLLEAFGVVFDPVEEEQVTAKIYVNLRTYPGVRSDDDIAATLNHGEWATRVAIGRNGWCMLEYNGQTLYAVNSYLTTDPNWTQQGPVSTDIEEFGTVFHAVSDMVTAKEMTNLRSQPTTDSEVVFSLTNGEAVARTGYSDTGWSRLSWNGQTLYAVTNYLEVVEN